VAPQPRTRLAQRLSRQFRVEQAAGPPVWVYLYKGGRLFHWDTPPEVDALIRDPAARAKRLAESPEGYFREGVRMAVDEPADLERTRAIFETLGHDVHVLDAMAWLDGPSVSTSTPS